MKNLSIIISVIMMCGMSAAEHKTDLKLAPCLEDDDKIGCSHGSKRIPKEKVMYTNYSLIYSLYSHFKWKYY